MGCTHTCVQEETQNVITKIVSGRIPGVPVGNALTLYTSLAAFCLGWRRRIVLEAQHAACQQQGVDHIRGDAHDAEIVQDKIQDTREIHRPNVRYDAEHEM